MKKQLTIAVTGLNNIDSPGPGVPVIRALRDSEDYDVRIIGLSYETLEPGIYMHDLVDHVYQIPFPKSGTEVIYGRMAYINSMEKIDFLFPNFDAELFNFIKLADRMEQELGIKTCLPTLDQFESRHKVNLEEFGEKYGLKVPKSKMIFSPAEIQDLTQDFTFPMVVKGQFYDAHIAYNKGQVEAHFNKLAAKWGLPIVIQEFVYGTEVNIVALGDGEGNTVGMVPMRKQYITDKGKAWAGVSIDDEGLLNECDKMIRESKWKGGLELEYIKTSDDEYYLLEINPRFPAWVYLAVGCGQNLPDAAVKIGMGEKVPSFDTYEVGKMFIRYSWDMIVDMKQFEEISTTGELGPNSKSKHLSFKLQVVSFKMKDFKKLVVWQKSMDLVESVFQLVNDMDMNTKISIGSQLSRSAVSIPSNIAEGAGRSTDKEFSRFLDIAVGSSFELETQLLIVGRSFEELASQSFDLVENTQEIQKMLSGLKRSVNNK